MVLVKKIKDRKVNIEFNKEFIKVINEKIKNKDTDFLDKSLKELLPADSADIIENLSPENRSKLIELEGFNIDPEIFVELNESIQTEIFLLLSVESIASLLKKLESDDALKILENLDKSKKETVLNRLPPRDRFLLEEGLSYPEDTAARIMQREFAAIPSNWSVGQTIDYLRENKDLPDEFLDIFIVDSDFKPIGTVPSSKVLRTARETKMDSIMREMQVLIPVNLDQEEVGHTFENYNLTSAGVVDKNNKLVGMITSDDILTVVKEEAEEDVLRLAGVGDEEITDSILKKTKRRFLDEFDIYSSLEPCALCASAISFCRIKRIFFCAYDTKFGAIVNGVKIFNKKNSMFRPKIIDGIEEKFFSQLLKDFFKSKR